MNVLSLFSGIGGLELGLEWAGMTTVGQVEIDPYCQRVLAKHWPEVPRHDDVRTAADWWLSQDRPGVDLVCGGFPCQPFSIAGRKQGVDDERWMWPAMDGVIRALRPRYVLVENVPRLVGDRVAFGIVLADLAASGYDTEWDCIPASALGAPHQRDRVWLVATHTERVGVRQQPVSDPGSSRASLAVADGTTGRVADTPGNGRRSRWPGGSVRDGQDREIFASARLAHTQGQRRRASRTEVDAEARADRAPGDASKRGGVDPWAAEPDVGRVADGVPDRVDRLHALGNAVVPQVAEYVGQLILAHDEAVRAA